MHKLTKNHLILLGAFLAGVLSLALVHFLSAKTDSVHYHANFALYMNGARDEFNGPGFYEEVQSCSLHESDDPKIRSHMHDQKNHVVHVHDHGVTWAAFFANLGFVLGDNFIDSEQGLLVAGSNGRALTFILNGQIVESVANNVIGNKDVLLVNYGSQSPEELRSYYDAIPRDAITYNQSNDPAACNSNEHLTFTARLKNAFGF